MSVRVRYKLEVAVSSSSSSEDKDLGNQSYLVINDSATDGGTRKVTLAAGVTDVDISMNEITTARFILIKTNAAGANDTAGTIEVKKNTISNEVIEIVPMASANQGHLLLSTDSVTGLFASNPGSVDMEITVVIAGD